ncbi:hypothetical protein RAC89_17165 [Paenibacillus sp. GD4]|jgi:hypothetical protein|uniref:hypothetical protein n=1 Tax=Paenibacillus sp. GD4 TaxID=3068890 RepID=UPI002796A2AD|nr:hypothetical protein [Paenibacillus sp. GD4]MDQ1912118.1 hypothetical protein [Paenibacillus sp. GD4]
MAIKKVKKVTKVSPKKRTIRPTQENELRDALDDLRDARREIRRAERSIREALREL